MKPILTLLLCLLLSSINATTTLHCPPDQTLTCTAQTTNLSAYGQAYIMKNGVQYDAGLAYVEQHLNSCNVGTILRRWEALDANGHLIECTQTLTLTAGNFNITHITWPESEFHLEGCDNQAIPDSLPYAYREPRFDYVPCSHVGTSKNDETFIFGSDCKKIVRKWTVIDWCNYNPGHNSSGIWTYTQVFKVSNGTVPTLVCKSKLDINPLECDSSFVDVPEPTFTGESCSGTYKITNSSIYADTTTINASGVYPIGDYRVNYKLEYGCGNEAFCSTLIKVTGDVRPVPYCLATLNIVLMPVDSDQDGLIDDGMVEVWAKDVNVNSYHPCHNEPLTFTFDAAAQEMNKTFTCAEVGHNLINMYVTDPQGKQSFCKVDINVQNNGAQIPNCVPIQGTGMRVAGIVSNPMGEAISQVYVTHKDKQPMSVEMDNGHMQQVQYVESVWTDDTGAFSAENLMLNRSFEVYAYKQGDVSQVTQADIDILESYIKGESVFQSPYTYLAADINEDMVVDINDYHLLKNLLGASENAWPNQKQWIFYRKTSVDNMSSNPLDDNLPQMIEMTEIQAHMTPILDFIGIMKGNLDYYEAM